MLVLSSKYLFLPIATHVLTRTVPKGSAHVLVALSSPTHNSLSAMSRRQRLTLVQKSRIELSFRFRLALYFFGASAYQGSGVSRRLRRPHFPRRGIAARQNVLLARRCHAHPLEVKRGRAGLPFQSQLPSA